MPDPIVIEIHPDARYVVLTTAKLSQEEVMALAYKLKEWWAGGERFCVLSGDVKLVRLDEV